MKSNIPPMQTDTCYHIYNRGVNGENLFREAANYDYFLTKYAKYIQPVADTYAYCLLKNHFHLAIKTKREQDIKEALPDKTKHTAEEIISRQFSHLFNGYAQGFNKKYGRTGLLFETPFRRIAVTSDSYLSHLISYIHFNPQRHRLCADFREWPYSSYHTYLTSQATRLKREEGLSWFGGIKQFMDYHNFQKVNTLQNEYFVIEFD